MPSTRLGAGASGPSQERPIPGRERAYLLWSLKRPEEVEALRKVYREGFFLIGVFAPRAKRKEYLCGKGMSAEQAEELIQRDELEEKSDDTPHGQQTSKTFHLADVFVDITAPKLQVEIDRS